MFVDVVPGTSNERKVVERIRSSLEDRANWINEVRLPVIAWEERSCRISLNGREETCLLNPYFNGSAELEGRAHVIENYNINKCSDICVLRAQPDIDVFSLRLLVSGLLRREDINAVLLAFNGPPKKLAFTFNSMPMDIVSSPPPKPVASISSELAGSIRNGEYVRGHFSARAWEGEGSILIAGLNGSGEDVIHITAHHDKYFGGSGHSSVGLRSFEKILQRLSGTGGLPNIELISYSAKELGDRELTAYNFSWGSRYLLGVLERRGALERVRACINLDDIYERPGLMIAPGLEGLAEELMSSGAVGHFGYSHAGLDSLIYNMHGVPAIAVTSMPGQRSRELHNSEADNEGNVEVEQLAELSAEIVSRIVRRDPRGLFSSERAYSSLIGFFGEAPSYVRALISRLARDRLGIPPREWLRGLFSLSFAIKGPSELDIRTNFLADLMLLNELARCPLAGELLVASFRETVIDMRGGELGPIWGAMERLALKYDDVINKIAELIICKQQKGAGLEHGVGEHR